MRLKLKEQIPPQLPPPCSRKKGWPWFMECDLVPLHKSDGRSWPKISIVTPSFNQAEFLEETIRSVLLQGYPNLEYFVVDGGSTDCSVEIIRKYEPWLSWWVSEPDRGQAEAINKGARRATGEWFAWLNSDDLYLPGTLHALALLAAQNTDADWVVGNLQLVDAYGDLTGVFNRKVDAGSWLDFVCTKWPQGTALPQPPSFWKRELFSKVGFINEQLHFAMDHEFWGRLAYHGCRPLITEQPLARFRDHGSSKTASGWLPFYHEELEIVKAWRLKVSGPDAERLAHYAGNLKRLIRRRRVEVFRQKIYGWLHG